MKRLFTRTTKKHKKGFSLMEAIISITIFAIMGTMFASFMISSVRVVNLTVSNDKEREMLIEAIAASKVHGEEHVVPKPVDPNAPAPDPNAPPETDTIVGSTQYKDITISVLDSKGSTAKLTLEIATDGSNLALQGGDLDNAKYVIYTAPSGTTYSIYLGDFPINIEESLGDGSVDKPGESETPPETGGGAEGGGATEGGTTTP